MSEETAGLPQTVPQGVEDATKRKLVTQEDADQADIESSRAPLMDHLIELRARLFIMVAAFVIGVIGCYCFHAHIMGFLVHPLAVAAALYQEQQSHAKAGPFDLAFVLLGMKTIGHVKDVALIATAPMEVFFTNLRIAMFGGFIVSFPVLAFQLYRFIAPGLYRR
mgnify:CR=1 FL=1